jgi:hypothetical protein
LTDISAKCGHSRRRIAEDWIALMFYALQRNDSEYLSILESYEACGRKNEIAEHFSKAFAHLLVHMQKTNEEVLGEIWMDFCSNEVLGQFFTPMNICTLMARMMQASSSQPSGRFTVVDPATGSGRMLVAQAKEMTCEQGNRCLFIGIDLDKYCCMMTALNMCFFNLNAIVIHGDGLNPLDISESWVTERSLLYGGAIHAFPVEEAKKFLLRAKMEDTVMEHPVNEEKISSVEAYIAREEQFKTSNSNRCVEQARMYLSALKNNDALEIAHFESFGEDIRHIAKDKANYELGLSVWGFTEKAFDEHGWLERPKFSLEEIVFETAKSERPICSNIVRIGSSPNGRWAYGLSCGNKKSGRCFSPSVYGTPYESREDCLKAALTDMLDWHRKSPESAPARIIKQVKQMLESLYFPPVKEEPVAVLQSIAKPERIRHFGSCGFPW